MDDSQLLLRYVRDRDEAAFAELVRARVDLVYSAALRRVGGDEHRAREVTQQVFIDLAKKARRLAEHPCLAAWLHQSTRFAAANLRRAEAVKGRSTVDMEKIADVPEERELDWRTAAPVLDAALDELGEADRAAVVARFFEGRAFAEVGAVLGVAENAARMRTERALEKLRRALAKRGVTSSAGALGLALANQAVVAAPAGLGATVTAAGLAAGGAALVAGAGASGGAAGFWISMTTTKWGMGVATAFAVVAIGGAGWGVWHVSRGDEAARAGAGAEVREVRPVARGDGGAGPGGVVGAAANTAGGQERKMTLAEALALSDAFKRKAAMESLGHDTAARDVAEALRVLVGLKDAADRRAFIDGMMAAAAKMSPADAVLLAAEIPAGAERDGALRTLATFWGIDTDHESTRTMLRLGSPTAALGRLVAQKDPYRGIAWANALMDGESEFARRGVLGESVGALSKINREEAIRYAASLADEKDRMFANAQIGFRWGMENPEAAYGWATALADGESRRSTTQNVLIAWAMKDVDAATVRALALPGNEAADTLVSMSRVLLQRQNVAAAQAWAEQLPAGRARDEVLRDIAANAQGVRVKAEDGSVTVLPVGKAK